MIIRVLLRSLKNCIFDCISPGSLFSLPSGKSIYSSLRNNEGRINKQPEELAQGGVGGRGEDGIEERKFQIS